MFDDDAIRSATVVLCIVCASPLPLSSQSSPVTESGISFADSTAYDAIPLVSYDTDVGFGYGAKAFFFNYAGTGESFDVVLFNSTKGERWYRLVWSLPDFEKRQGTVYPFSVDITADYDKYLQNPFFGVGPDSRLEDRQSYVKEPFEVLAMFGKGLSPLSVFQAGLRARWVRNFGLSESPLLADYPNTLNTSVGRAITSLASLRFDTRNSYINPSRGMVARCEIETTLPGNVSNVSFTQVGWSFQWYGSLLPPSVVGALRFSGKIISGTNVPIQYLASLGGNQTLRGFPQDRFLGKTVALVNGEVRLPLVWRLGCVGGFDTGRVWSRPGQAGLSRWRSNGVVGLRLLLDTFIVRADFGWGKETTGFYLNFGQLF